MIRLFPLAAALAALSGGALSGAAALAAGIGAPVIDHENADGDWRPYEYPDAGFAVDFPEPPRETRGVFEAATREGARVFAPGVTLTANYGDSVYSVDVVNLAGANALHLKTVDQAVEDILDSDGVQLLFDTVVSMGGGGCGHYLATDDGAGVQSLWAIFAPLTKHRLYRLRAEVPTDRLDTEGAYALRFQQSLGFAFDPPGEPAPPPEGAESWEEHVVDPQGFAIRWPHAPETERGTYVTEHGVRVDSLTWRAAQDGVRYSVTTADLWRTPADDEDAIDQAVNVLARTGDIVSQDTISIAAGQCAQDLRIARADGERASVGVYFPSASHRLYLVQALLPSGAAPAQEAQADHFRESFRLLRNVENESDFEESWDDEDWGDEDWDEADWDDAE